MKSSSSRASAVTSDTAMLTRPKLMLPDHSFDGTVTSAYATWLSPLGSVLKVAVRFTGFPWNVVDTWIF